MGALAWAEAVTLQTSVNLLGGSGEQASRVHEYLREFWRRPNSPIAVLASDPVGRETSLVWGNKVKALMASMASVSGPHPTRLRIDEVDLVDLKLLDQALGQPMDKNGILKNVVLSSAHYEADGTLTEVTAAVTAGADLVGAREETGRLIERKAKAVRLYQRLMVEREDLIPAKRVGLVMAMLAALVREFIPDDQRRREFSQRFVGLLGPRLRPGGQLVAVDTVAVD